MNAFASSELRVGHSGWGIGDVLLGHSINEWYGSVLSYGVCVVICLWVNNDVSSLSPAFTRITLRHAPQITTPSSSMTPSGPASPSVLQSSTWRCRLRSSCVPVVANSAVISFICSRVQNTERAVDCSKANASVCCSGHPEREFECWRTRLRDTSSIASAKPSLPRVAFRSHAENIRRAS